VFAGGAESSDDQKEAKEQDFLAKLDKKERKKFVKNKQKDKIGTKDARVLMGGRTLAENAVLKQSKQIKKGRFNEITREKVHEKLKSRRLAIPQSRLLLN
jgi:hypothetical protein